MGVIPHSSHSSRNETKRKKIKRPPKNGPQNSPTFWWTVRYPGDSSREAHHSNAYGRLRNRYRTHARLHWGMATKYWDVGMFIFQNKGRGGYDMNKMTKSFKMIELYTPQN